MFKKFDKSDNGTVSYLEFLQELYGSEDKVSVFDYLSKQEQIIADMRVFVREKFYTYEDFIEAINI